MAAKSFTDIVYTFVKTGYAGLDASVRASGFSALDIAKSLGAQRSNVCTALNILVRDGRLEKIEGKTVLYRPIPQSEQPDPFELEIIGSDGTLKKCVQMAKAAVIYPPHGLHTLLVGQSGVGKTSFVEYMHRFAIQKGALLETAPFVSFNCAEYANNPQLLLAQLFGYVKGAFTGADQDHEGVVQKAHGGILFLDEIHRLLPEGQEMLFRLIDKGEYTPLGSNEKRSAQVLLTAATTEDPGSVLLATFRRRIPVVIQLPSLKEWTLEERMELLMRLLAKESAHIKNEISITRSAAISFLLYDCSGNIGKMQNDVQLSCAKAFFSRVIHKLDNVPLLIHYSDLSLSVRQGLLAYEQHNLEINRILDKWNCPYEECTGSLCCPSIPDQGQDYNIYTVADCCYEAQQGKDLSAEEIQENVFFDIVAYTNAVLRSNNPKRVVESVLSEQVQDFLQAASKRFDRIYSQQVYQALSCHLFWAEKHGEDPRYDFSNSIFIQRDMKEEYEFSRSYICSLQQKKGLKIALQEAAILALLLCVEDAFHNTSVSILLAQYGESTATSTSKVVQNLTGAHNIYAYDRELEKDFRTVYCELRDLIGTMPPNKPVLIFSDSSAMGLVGQLLAEECGMDIRVIDQVSVSLVVAAARYTMIGQSMDEILARMSSTIPAPLMMRSTGGRERVILTLCLTGEGSAAVTKNIILSHLGARCKGVSILPMPVCGTEDLKYRISKIMKEKELVAIVGTSNPHIYGVPFIPISELILNSGYSTLHRCLDIPQDNMDQADYRDLFSKLKDEITGIDVDRFSVLCMSFIEEIVSRLPLDNADETVHLIMHLACNLSWKKNGEPIPQVPIDPSYLELHKEAYAVVKNALQPMEKAFQCEFSQNEIIFLLMIILQQ